MSHKNNPTMSQNDELVENEKEILKGNHEGEKLDNHLEELMTDIRNLDKAYDSIDMKVNAEFFAKHAEANHEKILKENPEILDNFDEDKFLKQIKSLKNTL
ncbi:hypothetical protein [Roseivirga misakiensis]|uniref:Uncharacterized protein n=1 Tax=Roseivirga misakiensis TaxID=1563681 RepID=A0A1E5T367_9BACT|nr:hypothetical protein [Roseivirga misakiensis]OEK05781.1 hypothetical protein BFP71_06585 [Roseivirga misakiensis]